MKNALSGTALKSIKDQTETVTCKYITIVNNKYHKHKL